MIFIDLDKFKEVNDTLGHAIGDLLLIEVSRRLQQCVRRETDTVARLGGDEFVVLLPHVQDPSDAIAIAEAARDALGREFLLHQHAVTISTSIGIAFYPMHAIDAEELMRLADNALYLAKAQGRNCYKVAIQNR